ncbi:MAG: F0F1 ATP synthase subunit A [Bacteroidales bacterium]|nr:F0F1 ATP synthase subunit A [Bacteroidales bacterium]
MSFLSFLKKFKAALIGLTILMMIIISAMFTSMEVFARQQDETHAETIQTEELAKEAEVDAGKIIIDHLVDSHEWHLWTYKGHHVSIPLPVFLIHDGEFYAFMSDKLAHGHHHKGFYIAHEGENKGKIVREPAYASHGDDESAGAEPQIPTDISITKNVLAILISSILLIVIFVSIAKTYKRREGKAPKGLQSFMEPVIVFVRDDIAKSSIGESKYERYMPFLLTIFFFIFLNNLMGLVPFFPGGANVTGNIAVTGVMAVFTFLITTFSANRAYWQHIINAPGVPWWLKFPIPLMPVVEIVGMFTKPFVLMVRLFANITAGHTIILGFISLIFIFGNINDFLGVGIGLGFSIPFAIFMSLLELLVAFIQAYVFTLLSALYFGMAIEEHHS